MRTREVIEGRMVTVSPRQMLHGIKRITWLARLMVLLGFFGPFCLPRHESSVLVGQHTQCRCDTLLRKALTKKVKPKYIRIKDLFL